MVRTKVLEAFINMRSQVNFYCSQNNDIVSRGTHLPRGSMRSCSPDFFYTICLFPVNMRNFSEAFNEYLPLSLAY